jgi:hypothetical protein
MSNVSIGDRFGRVVVVDTEFRPNKRSGWRELWVQSKCDCGTVFWAKKGNLRSGNTTSCGCYKKDLGSAQLTTHGMSDTPIHSTWRGMIDRCKSPSRRNYGARGIVVCPEWHDFSTFASWSEQNGFAPGLEIDRIDTDGDYTPSNCRFVSHSTNCRNKRDNNRVSLSGETKCVVEWAEDERCIVSYEVLRARLKGGWEILPAMTTPQLLFRNKSVLAFGESKTLTEWASDSRCVVGIATLRLRVRNGVDPEQAITTPSERVGGKKNAMVG